MRSKVLFVVILFVSWVAMGAASEAAPLEVVNPPKTEESPFKGFVLRYLPKNLTPTTEKDVVDSELKSKVGEKVADDIFNGDFFKNTSFGKWIMGVNDTVSRSYDFGPTRNSGNKEESLFRFDIQAYRGEAGLHYTGFFSSAFQYEARDKEFQLVFSKDLNTNTKLFLKESASVAGFTRTSNINLQYTF